MKLCEDWSVVEEHPSHGPVPLLSLLHLLYFKYSQLNGRVYFPKWYIEGLRGSPLSSGAIVGRIVDLDFRSYSKFLNWMIAALQMPVLEF